MNRIMPSDKTYVATSEIAKAGRGVFAKVEIKKDELIEKCPVIEVSKHDTSNLTETILVTYFYYFGKDKERSVIVLGFGSLYNHTDKPNAIYKEKQEEMTIEFFASRDIKKNEEITVSYTQDIQNNNRPLWFKASE